MKMYSPKDIVKSGLCIGCGICVAQTEDATMQFDACGHLKPTGPAKWLYQSSDEFSNTCPFSPSARNEDELSAMLFPSILQKNHAIGRFGVNYVGFAAEGNFRMQGSSGGMVTWVATELMRKGLIDGVAHVVATDDPQKEGRFFKYRISRTEEEVQGGARSRYYPVELSEVLRLIKETPGRYAIVAIPCMIKAVQLLRTNDLIFRERIRFTLGLFCGHMKSARFVESFAWRMNVPIDNVKQVEFRYKYPERPANWYNAALTLVNGEQLHKDWWHLNDGDWGAGFFMNSACNFCDDVVGETADISFGDAWVEPYTSDGMGTNVVIIRSSLIRHMVLAGINEGKLKLEEVSAEFVAQTQAAGLRQRREGLAYRLTWATRGIQPLKRLLPSNKHLSRTRKLLYRMRYQISKWSHRMFWLARKTNMPWIYLFWARTAISFYYGMAYHQGSFREMRKRFAELKR